MRDLVVLELVIAAVTALTLLRPFIKAFRGVDGIVFLPFLGLAAVAALFSAFGFRPECLPLLVFELLLALLSIPRFIDVLRNLRTDDYREVPFLRVIVGMLFLIGVTLFAVCNAPPSPSSGAKAGFTEWAVRDDRRGGILYLRDYPVPATGMPTPLVVVIPPNLASVDAVDHYCRALSRAGYRCLTYSRPGLDVPCVDPVTGKKIWPPFFSLVKRTWLSLLGSTIEAKAHSDAALEAERLADLRFLVPFIRTAIANGDVAFATVDPARIVLAGFAEGGSSAVTYASEAPGALAVISVEGIFSSCFTVQEGNARTGNWWSDHVRSALERLSLLPVLGVSKPQMPAIPCLFILSDRVRDLDSRDGRYAADLRALRTAQAPCAIVSVEGAGRWDYTEIGREYPVYPALSKGRVHSNRSAAWYPEKAAELTVRFLAQGAAGFHSGSLDGPLVVGEYGKLWK